MPIKLIVNKVDEPDAKPESFVFHKNSITIGRDRISDLPLEDDKRVVSKQHAELVVGGGAVHLTDLGSKNFTYLNGQRLEAGTPNPIRPGDAIRIGPFEISVDVMEEMLAPVRPAEFDADQTVFDAAFVNPFEDDAKLLAVALRSLSRQYDNEAPNRRDDALNDALREALEGDIDHAAFRRVGYFLEPQAAAPPPPSPTLTPQAPAPPPVAPPLREPSPFTGPEDRLHAVLDAILHAAARLVAAPGRFRHEFLGHTIIQTEESAFLYAGNADALKRHLLDPANTDEQAAHRLRLLEEAFAALERHQVAMLDGYRAAVREGAVNLIDQLNPDALEQKAAQEKPLYRLLPFLAKAKALDDLHAQLRDLRNEDWAAAERRIYQPAFNNAYLKRMTAAPPPDTSF